MHLSVDLKKLNVFLLFAMLKNKNNFFETNIIIPKINKKWNSKYQKIHEIVHLIVDISLLSLKCAFRIRFNVRKKFTQNLQIVLTNVKK